MNYRHELKFIVSDLELNILKYRLMPLMHEDRHQKGGVYNIRSLYFDDFYDTCMHENEDGIDNRKKYRIRIYNGSDHVIKLEKKIKVRGMTRKISTGIDKEKCLIYMKGETLIPNKDSTDLEREFYAEIKMDGMHPVSIVEYERTAFVDFRGNTRITFDRNISGSEKIASFFDKPVLTPLLPKGKHILEVKYDELIPEYLLQVLDIGSLQRTAFSKYYLSRNYQNTWK